MRSRESIVRLQRFRVEEKRMQVADIEAMIADLMRKEAELTLQIRAEEERTGLADPAHFSYPTAARAAMTRRDNLAKSIEELKSQLEEAKLHLDEEEAELRKLELLAEKDSGLRRQAGARVEGEYASRADFRR